MTDRPTTNPPNDEPERDYLWDRSGKRDRGIDQLTMALAPLRPPAQRRSAGRWWLVPLIGAMIAASMIVGLIRPHRLPVQIVGLVSGETGATPMMIAGGSRVELEVLATPRSQEISDELADRLRDLDFEITHVTPDRIIAHRPSPGDFQLITALENAGLRRPYRLGVLVRDRDVREMLAAIGAELGMRVRPSGGLSLERTTVDKPATALRAALEREGIADLEIVGDDDDFSWYALQSAGPGTEVTAVVFERGSANLTLTSAARERLAGLAPDATLALLAYETYDNDSESVIGTTSLQDGLTPTGVSFNLPRHELRNRPRTIDQGPDSGAHLEVVSVQRLGPVLGRARVWLASGVFGLFGGGLVFALIALIGRRTSHEPRVDRRFGARTNWRLWLGTGLTVALSGVALIPIETPFARPFNLSYADAMLLESGLFELGLSALTGGFLAAFVLSLAIPSWRKDLKVGARFTRRGLIGWALTSVFLVVSPLFDEQLDFLAAISPVGDAMVVGAIAVLGIGAVAFLGRYALGGAAASLSLAFLVSHLPDVGGTIYELQVGAVGGGGLLVIVLVMALLVATTWRLLALRVGPVTSRIAMPVGGIAPVLVAVNLFVLVADPAFFDRHWDWGWGGTFLAVWVLAAALCLVLGRIELSSLWRLSAARLAGGERDCRRGERQATILTLGFVTALVALDTANFTLELMPFVCGSVLFAAALLDVVTEFRARWRQPDLVAAFPIHQPQLAPMIEHALDSRGIDVHLRAQHLRRCLGILGAFVPITVMVGRAQLDEASEIAASMLADAEHEARATRDEAAA